MKESAKAKYRFISHMLIIIIILLMALVYPDFTESERKLEVSYNFYRVAFGLGTFLIGMLLMQERLLHGIEKGFSVRWFDIVFPLLVLLILLVPATIGMKITGFGTDAIIMQEGMFRGILGVSGGVIFAQALTCKDEHL